MDLVATVRKEGSRGGRGDFKWSDVQSSSHRENYLGHSLMAPVGRWQKGRDLGWYAKGEESAVDGEDPAERAARERKEDIRKIKEAEQDALAKALGFEVAPRNPNMESLGDKREVERVLKEAVEEGDNDANGGKGVGFGTFGGPGTGHTKTEERMEEDTAMEAKSGEVEVRVGIMKGNEKGGSADITTRTIIIGGGDQDPQRNLEEDVQSRDHEVEIEQTKTIIETMAGTEAENEPGEETTEIEVDRHVGESIETITNEDMTDFDEKMMAVTAIMIDEGNVVMQYH